MNVLLSKLKEVLSAVCPVVVLVVVMALTIAPVPGVLMARFIIGAALMILGLAILLLGIEMGVLPFGNKMGETFLKSNSIWFILAIGFLLGFFVNMAEPDLRVLAAQVSAVMGGHIPVFVILVAVSVGTGLLLSVGIARIVKDIQLNVLFAIIYGGILILAIFASEDMLAIGFDASGATTGALTVPLVLALCVGVAARNKDSRTSEEDSFGLVGVMSAGAVLGVLILNALYKTDHITGAIKAHDAHTASILEAFIDGAPEVVIESLVALSPMIIILVVFQKIGFKMGARQFGRILRGFLYTYVGLVVFLIGVDGGFMDVGNIIGRRLASYENKSILVSLGFLIGMLVILTEPAVHILTHQIEDVTSGYIKRSTVLVTLSIGVAFAVGLSMLRIAVPAIRLWHYLLPGFIISLVLMFFVPKLFVGIAFDSGGVASGPMTATFILAFAQGASDAIPTSNILSDSFGVIAMVAMTPLIALQALGLIYKFKSRRT